MPYTLEQIAMAKAGYCYLKHTRGPSGLRKLVRNPERWEPKELVFDYPAYNLHKGKNNVHY